MRSTHLAQVQYFSFDEQITCFETVKKAMIAKIGKEAAEAAVNAALFQIGLGECHSFSILFYPPPCEQHGALT